MDRDELLALRPVAIDAGMNSARCATFASLLATACHLGLNAFARLCSSAGPSPLHPAGLAPRAAASGG